VAGLYVTGANGVPGTLVAAAARDMNLTAATISSAGTATLQAASSLNLQALTQSQSINTTRDASNYIRMAQSQSVGTTVQASHNVTLSAGQDLTATAATINSTSVATAIHAAKAQTRGNCSAGLGEYLRGIFCFAVSPTTSAPTAGPAIP